MYRKIDPENITVACKTCGEIFHSVEALEAHERNFWNRISHMAFFGPGNELDTHKSLYQAGHKVSCIVCEVPYDKGYVPNAVQASSAYLIEER